METDTTATPDTAAEEPLAAEAPGTPAARQIPEAQKTGMKAVYRAAWIFAAPGIIVFILFAWYPLIMGFFTAFYKWQGVNQAPYVGLANFRAVFTDPMVLVVLKNTFEYTALSILLTFMVPVIISILLMEMGRRTIRVMMILWFIPVSSMAGTVIWKWLYNRDYGLLNSILVALHLPPSGWLNDYRITMLALIFPGLIMYGPQLIYIAALQSIPSSYYEAADLEGMGFWQKIRYVTLPRLRPLVVLFLVLSTIGNMSEFAGIMAMTGGGPANRTRTVTMYLFQKAFEFWDFGYATALAVMFFFVLGILVVLQRLFLKENVDI